MTPSQAEEYFQQALRDRALCAGTNYVVDNNDETVAEAMVWANGGVWYVKIYRQGDVDYQRKRLYALLERRTVFRSPINPKTGIVQRVPVFVPLGISTRR